MGETLTYAAHRVLLSRQPLAREFSRSEISKNFPAINTILPENDNYRRDMAGGFQGWRLSVDGMVANPHEFSLTELPAVFLHGRRSRNTFANKVGRRLQSGPAFRFPTS